jgi:hypothetical protein
VKDSCYKVITSDKTKSNQFMKVRTISTTYRHYYFRIEGKDPRDDVPKVDRFEVST